MNIVEAGAQQGSTYFYKVFSKKTNFSFQPIVINFDTTTKTGDYFYATIPDQGRRIMRMWLDLGSVPTSNLTTVDILINKVMIYSFPGEYIAIHNAIRTSQSKKLPNQILVPIMKYLPVLPEMQVRIAVAGASGPQNFKLFADWVYDTLPIDGDYILNQVQYLQASLPGMVRMNFKNVVKELIFVVQDQGQSPLTFTDQIATMSLMLNDQKKFENTGTFFKYIQPMMYHTGNSLGVYMYSFALFPEDESPSGGLNFSRINNQILMINPINQLPKNLRVYALSYNVLRVKDGKANIMFDNL
jgi:hypothetical protein